MVTNVNTFSESVSTSHFMGLFSVDSTTSGLTIVINSGVYFFNGLVLTSPLESLLLAASGTNFVYVDPSINRIQSGTTFPNHALLYTVTTDISSITNIADNRGSIPTTKASAW